jgi:phospholipase C
VFVADPNGGIYTTSGNADEGWAPWSSVSEGSAAPGSPVTAVEVSERPGRFAVFVADPNGGIYTTSGSAVDQDDIPLPEPILYAPRTHSALIELAAGEERLYRLLPVSKGQVVVKAFHADVSLRASGAGPGGPEPSPATRRVDLPPSLGRPDLQALALDDDNGGGPHVDTSPARNLELELRHGDQIRASHDNLVQADSPNHTDGWRLRIRRLSPLNDPTPNPGQYRIEATYMSQLPILERRIPASFFHDGFELNWNKQQYVYGYISGSKVFIYFREDLRLLHGLDDLVIETGVPLVEANNIHTTSVRLDIGAGPSPRGGGNTPFFSVRVDCAADGMIEVPLLPDVTLPAFYVTVRFYLCRRVDELEYVPVVESDLLDLLADVEIPDPELPDILNTVNASETAKKAIEDALYRMQFPPQSGFSSFGHFLTPWLIGDRHQLWSIGYAPGAADSARADGIIEPATGELLVSFVSPRARLSTDPVIEEPDGGSPPSADGSIRLFDVPEEDPDPEPDTGGWEPPGGGGATRPPPIGSLAKIDHIVVLMMENRSFDQVLGYLSRELGRTDVNGLNDLPEDPQVNSQYNRHNDRNFFPRRALSTAWPSLAFPGPCHETDCVMSQIDENMGRFVASFAERVGNEPEHLRLVMDYFNGDQLPVYDVLAREFGICDSWYTSHAGPTWPNRFVLFTGDLNLSPTGNVEQDNPDVKTMLPIQAPSLFDHLSERGVSWRVFENGYSFIRLYRSFTYDTTNVVPFDDPVRGFEVAARSGALPQVTLIEPDYIDIPPGNDDHPPGDMANGQDFINRIVQSLIASPQWERTLFVITYDEHGGFYDHKPPPTNAPPLRGGRRTLGPRVPTFVVSPFVERGAVFHSRFDHTSIGATILRRFAGLRPPPRISQRLDSALDLREALALPEPRPRSDFDSLGLPPLNARRSVARSTLKARNKPIGHEQGKDDFHWLLSFMRLFTGEGPR